MKKKINSISGVTLIEILIGIVVSTVMMAAMYTSYNVVNSTYSQVTDTAKISSTGRDVVGMILGMFEWLVTDILMIIFH